MVVDTAQPAPAEPMQGLTWSRTFGTPSSGLYIMRASAGSARPLRHERRRGFRADGRPRRRGARAAQRHRHVHAEPDIERAEPRRRRGRRPNLGVEFKIIPIDGIHRASEAALAPIFAGTQPNIAEENIQARIRGNIVMAYANKFGVLPLATGNKSELAVGYCTLYGDMVGGLAVIGDVPKTLIYQLARYVNRNGEVITRSVLEAAHRRAQAQPDRPGRAAPLRPAACDTQLYIEEVMDFQRDRREGRLPTAVRRVLEHGGPGGVQAPAGAHHAARHAQGLRPRPAVCPWPRTGRGDGRVSSRRAWLGFRTTAQASLPINSHGPCVRGVRQLAAALPLGRARSARTPFTLTPA